jgi:glycosyltransferase A (GT-A) superfamily protein (DUF2064 family)
LFFSHRPEREWQNKRFVPHDRAKSRAVAGALYRNARRVARSSGLSVLEVTGDEQRGATFGTRLANALADAFAQGYEHVIAVGGDCPRLHEVNWAAVEEQLASGAPVLGPTGRGGTYLIGLSRAHFDAAAFADLPWQSPALCAALCDHLTARAPHRPHFLAVRGDVNGHHDLLQLVRAQTPARALAFLLRLILGVSVHRASSLFLVSRASVRRCPLRGPPVA